MRGFQPGGGQPIQGVGDIGQFEQRAVRVSEGVQKATLGEQSVGNPFFAQYPFDQPVVGQQLIRQAPRVRSAVTTRRCRW